MGSYDEALRDLAGVVRQLSAMDSGPGTFTRAEGSDGSTRVHVSVGRDGVPETIRVEHGWQRTLGTAGLAAAVTEAAADARIRAGGDAGAADLFARATTIPGPEPADRASDVEAVFAAGGRTRPAESFLADAERYADDAGGRLDPARLATGTAAGGRLTIGLTPAGSVSCEADEDWLARQDAGDLTEALNRALAGARAEWYTRSARRTPWRA